MSTSSRLLANDKNRANRNVIKIIHGEIHIPVTTPPARTFVPALTREEYAAQMAMSVGGVVNQKSIAKVAMAMAKEAGSEDLIRKLEALIEESK